MTDIISHRGPDDEGYVVFDLNSLSLSLGGEDTPEEAYHTSSRAMPVKPISAVQDMQIEVALGHRRLSIIDLSVYGHQPMCSSDGALWITYNGEIYNYLELRSELIEAGHRFISDTDTEVILAAYQEWGEQCLHRFNGMWSFAIYDRDKGELFLSRDRFGIKPLYYWFDPENNFYFGSEIKQFTACKGWKAEINSQRAYDFLVYSLTDHTDETLFKGVNQLPPGHYFKANVKNIVPDQEGKIKTIKWYDLERNPSNITFDEACSEFEEHFKNAVRVHLRSDVPVGSALSGGLDSSAIVCEINNILRQEGKHEIQKTFSSCSYYEKYDEKKWMDIVTDYTKTDAYFFYPGTERLFELTSDILWYHDEPYQSQSSYLGYHVFQLAKKHSVKVLLNGQGADEYLGGYGQFNNAIYFELFKKLRWGSFYKELKSANVSSVSETLSVIGYLFTPEKIRNMVVKYFSTVSDVKALIDMDKLAATNIHPYAQIPNDLTSVSGITRLNLFHNPLTKYLRWEDRNSMAHSIEARVPFLDHRLVEFTYNLPSKYLFSNGETKRVMRYGLKDILPAKIAARKDKKGFITPEEHWVKNGSRQIFRDKIKDAITTTNGIIKSEALTYYDDIAEGNKPFDYTYLRLILFSEWMKIFNVSAPD